MSFGKSLLSRPEGARILSVSLRTIDYLIERGELAVCRIGRRVLITRRSLEELARKKTA